MTISHHQNDRVGISRHRQFIVDASRRGARAEEAIEVIDLIGMIGIKGELSSL